MNSNWPPGRAGRHFQEPFLKRLESSIDAFRISIRRALEFVKTFEEYVQDNIMLDAASFQKAMRLLEDDDEDSEDTTPASRAAEIDELTKTREFIEGLPRLDPSKYDRRGLHRDLTDDIDALTESGTTSKTSALARCQATAPKTVAATDLRGRRF